MAETGETNRLINQMLKTRAKPEPTRSCANAGCNCTDIISPLLPGAASEPVPPTPRQEANAVRFGLLQLASTTHRNPTVPERSVLGAMSRNFPCSLSLSVTGKYQRVP